MSRKKTGIIELAMRHRQIVILFVSMLVLFGIYALDKMPKQEFPSFTIRQGLVIGVYPGATSAEVEEQVTKPLEQYIFSYKEVKKRKTYTESKDGMVIVHVELNDNVKNKDEFWSKFKHGLSLFKSELPSGVVTLIANDDFGDTSALLITLESDDKTYRELEDYLEELENRLRRVESVSNLRRYGLQKEQISVYLDKDKLATYGISLPTLSATLFGQGFTTMSGVVDNDTYRLPIHISDTYPDERSVAEQIVYSDITGHVVRLKDVARIVREYPSPDSYIKNNGKKCILLSMEMQKGNNIVEYGKEVEKVLKEFQQELPESVSVYRIADQPKVVELSVSTFLKELLMAILTVILVVVALLPLRVALVASSTIPITIFISLGILFASGIELNTVTLAGLIVVLGMIVDNSIVIVDSYLEKLDEGMSRWHASIASTKEFFKSILSATLAISITFFPFLITMTGMFNDFLQAFPWTITITLAVSLLVAVLLVPFMQYFFIKKGLHAKSAGQKKEKKNLLGLMQKGYEKVLEKTFLYPKATLTIGVISVSAGLCLFGLLPQRLMPIAERDQFAVEIYLPKGNSLQNTAAVADSLEALLRKDNRVRSVTSFIGNSSPRFHTSYAPQMPGENYAQFIVNTISSKAMEEMLDAYSDTYTNYFPNATLRFKQLDYSEAKAPIEIRVSGNDLEKLKESADTLMGILRKADNLKFVRTNFEDQLPGAYIRLNNDEANRLGVNKTMVSLNMAASYGNGVQLTTLWDNDYPLKVMLKQERYGSDEKMVDIENEYVSSVIPGVSVPLHQIATVEPDWTDGQIVRRNGIRSLSVYADVKGGVNTTAITSEIQKELAQLDLPEGVTLTYGGELETDAESLPQIIGGLSIAVFIIFFILVFHYKKINLSLLTMASILLCVLGAALGILIMGVDFGVTSILGIVSLMGIVVRNGIIMFDYAEQLRLKHGLTAREAAFLSGKRRMRPIFLTSAAASMGVVPMILSKSPLWAPMGSVIFFGTLITMVFLVTILPVSYWLLFRKCDKVKTVNMESI